MTIRHLNIAPSANHPREPLCHATAQDGRRWSQGYYTHEAANVTCRRCLKSIGTTLPLKSAEGPLLAKPTFEDCPF